MALKDTLHAHRFHFKKKFGQNFITDAGLLSRITKQANLSRDDVVLEIGAGAGTLTQSLAKAAGKVIALEIDPQLKNLLHQQLEPYDNVHLVMGDALKTDFDILVKSFGGEYYKIVANLPYYITTPLIMQILEQSPHCTEAIVMVQKEVAERLTAPPGNKTYGAISVMVQYYAEVQALFQIPRSAFTPVPDVDSTVLRLRRFDTPTYPAYDAVLLRSIVRAAFSQRRKTLRNALSTTGIDRTVLLQAMAHCDIDPGVRGETLAQKDFVCLSNALSSGEYA